MLRGWIRNLSIGVRKRLEKDPLRLLRLHFFGENSKIMSSIIVILNFNEIDEISQSEDILSRVT